MTSYPKPAIRRAVRCAGLAITAACLGGCFTSVGAWSYPSGRYPTTRSPRPAEADVAVERFLDLRSETNRSSIAWAFVPLFPFGWTHFDRPEATGSEAFTPGYDVDPTADLARSVATELRRSGVVASARYVADGIVGDGATHVLRGKLRAFYVHETRWSYGVSVHAVLLWYLALPVGSSANGFCVDLELVRVADGETVWQGRVFDADRHIEGVYYGPEWYRFGWMWERRLRATLVELGAALGAAPVPLPEKLAAELREDPPRMPACLGVDAAVPCTAR